MLADLTDELDAMLHMERDPAATNMAWKKVKKQTNKRENKHIKKEDYFKKTMMITVPYFFYEIQTYYRASTLRRWQLRKKNYLLFHIPRFFQNWLTHEKKIPLLLTHSFLIIIPLLQRNDAYWIMYLKKEKNTQKDDCHNPPKIETIYRWFTLCLLQNYYTHFNRKLFSPSTYLPLHYKYVLLSKH